MTSAVVPVAGACQICKIHPATRRLGFPRDPLRNPGIPDPLLGSFLSICHAVPCQADARRRALRAASGAPVNLCWTYLYESKGDDL